ncbi:DUF3570 domain-containing protein [Sanyastnella coralliicola]|uniref:DUF3570 domain-containing protein n=1 Tax=Sanyastnella coralliicola TaxID=3069118 RepID=UPI0027BAB445|nr:DUF3570 domain-containing protein [Longitalea sp. SCSIO 12813]
MKVYKKRVLESTEIDIISSYYQQDGQNAAVTGGIGTEFLTDATMGISVSVPLNDDDVLTVDGNVSAYTSASSSNVGPFDGQNADAFVASTGASHSDVWTNANITYSHSSDDRNQVISGTFSISNEYDYFSLGLSGNYTRLFNKKNTELSLKASAFLDRWNIIIPMELRPPGNGGDEDDDDNFDITQYTVTGNTNYAPLYTPLGRSNRNSYAGGFVLSQVLGKRTQASLAVDLIMQDGLLSTPFQRVYFSDIEDSFIQDFHLAEDVERLPSTRMKFASGVRLHHYFSEYVVARSFYRFYVDDWGIVSHTASIELPVKLGMKFTLYPSYRFYQQTEADYFKAYNQHLSTDEFYTSDYDLSNYTSDQFGIGFGYTDLLVQKHLGPLGLKSLNVKYYFYERNTGLRADLITFGAKFVME